MVSNDAKNTLRKETFIMSNKKNNKTILSLVLVLIVLLESFVNSNVLIKSLNNEFGYHTRSSYTDFKESVKPIIEKIENLGCLGYRINPVLICKEKNLKSIGICYYKK